MVLEGFGSQVVKVGVQMMVWDFLEMQSVEDQCLKSDTPLWMLKIQEHTKN